MNLLKLRSKGDSVRLLQELLNKSGYNLVVDGTFGRKTENAVKDFQLKNNLISDGIVGTKTWTVLNRQHAAVVKKMTGKFLSDQDLIDLSTELDIPLPCIKAVYEVESSGRGFLSDGRPKILFEGHIFWKQLKKKGINPVDFLNGNENILYKKWTTEFYKGGSGEYERLEKAKIINEEAALESASWGIFQIMGFHYKLLEYDSVYNFVNSCYESERNHLLDFGKFIKANGLVKFLKKTDWKNFAYRYNGPGYATNKYDIKLEKAYKKYCT